jgi:DNA-binding NarL/FixJ family response regulator
VSLDALLQDPPIRQAGIATINQAVFDDVKVTLARIGHGRLLHLSPAQLLSAHRRMLWIVDVRIPGSMALMRRLLAEGHPHGMALTTPHDSEHIRECVRMGLPALVMHREVEPPPLRKNPFALTRREIEVLTLVSQGLGNTAVASELGLSMLTVKSHLARMYRRTGARDRAHLVLLAMRDGLIR